MCFRQLRRSSHLTGLCLHLLVGSFLQSLDHGQRCVFHRVSAQIVVITNLENCLHAGKLWHIQLTTIQLDVYKRQAHSKLHNQKKIQIANDEQYQEIELFDKPGLFSNGRIVRDKMCIRDRFRKMTIKTMHMSNSI